MIVARILSNVGWLLALIVMSAVMLAAAMGLAITVYLAAGGGVL